MRIQYMSFKVPGMSAVQMKQLAIFLLLLAQIGVFQSKLAAQAKLSGHVSYYNSSQTKLDGINVYLVNVSGLKVDSIKTDPNGYYVFNGVPSGSYFVLPAIQKAWGGCKSVDALLTSRHFVGLTTLSGIPLSAADVDASGGVNSIDALLDLKRFVGIINLFGAGDWICSKDTIIIASTIPVIKNIDCLCFGDVDGSYTPLPCFPFPTQANAGPDTLNIPADSIALSANTPVYGTGSWTILSGQGGVLSNASLPNSFFKGVPGKTYKLKWSVTSPCYTSTDTVTIKFKLIMNQPCNGIPTITYGGTTYNTVQIGTQCWLRENINIGNMINAGVSPSNNGIIEKYCYNNNPANCVIYGGLYNWKELMQYTTTNGAQGICPGGWHVPTKDEFSTLFALLDSTITFEPNGAYGGTLIAQSLKEAGTAHWVNGNYPGTNTSGFTALGCGIDAGGFYFLNSDTRWWSSSSCFNGGPNQAFRVILSNSGPGIELYCVYFTGNHYSVRCMKN